MPHYLLHTFVAASAALLLPSLARAQPAFPDCPNNFPGGIPPRVAGQELSGDVSQLCYDGFAVMYSRSKPGPLSSSHFLTKHQMAAAAATPSATSEHAEARLPPNQRTAMSDYATSGYAVGQLSPTADMPNAASKSESATLANAVPQTPALNRGLWKSIEQITRNLASKDDVIYVVSGPIFGPGTVRTSGQLAVPEGVYKAIYNPEQGWAGAYVCQNTSNPTCQTVTIAQLQQMTGVDVFPALPEAVKNAAAPLPSPAG